MNMPERIWVAIEEVQTCLPDVVYYEANAQGEEFDGATPYVLESLELDWKRVAWALSNWSWVARSYQCLIVITEDRRFELDRTHDGIPIINDELREAIDKARAVDGAKGEK